MGNIIKEVEEAIKRQVSLEINKRIKILEEQLDNYRMAIKETEKLVSKYAKVFKGFQSPSQYMNFIAQTHPSLLLDLQAELRRRLGMPNSDIVFYVDNTIKLNQNQQYFLRTDEAFILGAIAFKTKVTGNIEIWRGRKIYRVFKQTARQESWLPLFMPKRAITFWPDEIIYVDAPEKPMLYVIKAELRGRAIH